MNKFLITTIILIFFNSTIVKALQIECRTYGNSEYQLIKDSKGITLDHNNRYNSLIQESYINFIFYKKYAVINLTIKYYYLSDSKKNRPKLSLDNKIWNNFSYKVKLEGPNNRTLSHAISFNSEQFQKFKSAKELKFITDSYEATINLTKLPLNKIIINNNNFSENITCKADKEEKKIIKKSSSVEFYDKDKYAICYGQMTKAHKKRGFHDSNRVQSIKVKETVCKAFAKGEINDYEGKR